MTDHYVFKVKSPKLSGSNIRIANRTPGLTPIGPIEIEVPTLGRIFFAALVRLPLLALGLLLASFIVHKSLFGASIFAVPALIGAFWTPTRLLKERAAALRINAWEPPVMVYNEDAEIENDHLLLKNIRVRTPSKLEVWTVCIAMLPVFLLGVVSAISTVYFLSIRFGAHAIPLFPISIFLLTFGAYYPIRKIKQRRDALRINAWEPDIERLNSSS